MKNLCFLSLAILTASCTFAQNSYLWKATVMAVDESGKPVVGATADIGYYTNSQPADAQGITDSNGMFTASRSVPDSLAGLGLQAEKIGYYSTRAQRQLGPAYDPSQWIFTQTLVLKNIGKPIPMYAKQILSLKFPEYNKAIGYDLMAGDWVAPYGKGINSDFLFTENHADTKSGYTFTINFPHQGDGIQGFSRDWSFGVSGFLSSHEAPIDDYQPKYEQTQMPDPNHIYYFRVRTVKDHEGNIVSAHYGKIYGDFMQFTYYLNPTPNDRNIEFDPKQNLIQGLQSFEQVRQP